MLLSDQDARDLEPHSLFEVMIGMKAEHWDTLSLEDGDDDEHQLAPG
jgi:hypothetical protein